MECMRLYVLRHWILHELGYRSLPGQERVLVHEQQEVGQGQVLVREAKQRMR